MSIKPFVVAGIQFNAVRVNLPRPHWCVQALETGVVFEAGAGGIKNNSVPAMMKSIEDILVIAYKGDVIRLRLGFDLPRLIPLSHTFLSKQDDRDVHSIAGMYLVKAVGVPHGVADGDLIDVHMDDGAHLGTKWKGDIQLTMTEFAEQSAFYKMRVVEQLTMP